MADYQIIWTLRAVAELDSIGEHIARDSQSAAHRVTESIQTRVAKLAQFPFSGAKFRRTRNGLFREVSYKKYRIFYRVDRRQKHIYIAAIWHGARREPRSFG